MKRNGLFFGIFVSLCLIVSLFASGIVSADGASYSDKNYVPDKADFVDYYVATGNIDPKDGGGVTTFAHAGLTVPLNGSAIEMNTLFTLYSKVSTEEGGDGIDGWVTYSFSATPAESTSDKTYPYHGGTKNGYFLHVNNVSKTTVPNCAMVEMWKLENGTTTSVTNAFFVDGAVNVRIKLTLVEGSNGKYTLTFTRLSDNVELKKIEDLELDKSLFVNEKGQTFFSTAIYEGPGCDGQHWEHRGVSVYSVKAYTLDADSAVVTLEKDSYEFEQGTTYKPAVTVKIGNTTLEENVDYYLEYANNRAVGTATVKVYFIGEYAGNDAITKNFTIVEPQEEQEEEEEEEEEKGCKGCNSALGGIALLPALALAGISLRKKEE